MDTTAKGNRLEDAFYDYLLEQQRRGVLVYDSIPPDHCKILRKQKYYCKDRGADVEFDIVIELYRPGRPSPHSNTVFECKNYDGAIPEIYVADFSDKLSRLFRNAAKGVLVVSSRLQSGAENVARSRLLGIVKYDERGLEVVADRKGGLRLENNFLESQLFPSVRRSKSLKFSAYHDGRTYGSLDQLFKAVHPELFEDHRDDIRTASVPFVTSEELKRLALTSFIRSSTNITGVMHSSCVRRLHKSNVRATFCALDLAIGSQSDGWAHDPLHSDAAVIEQIIR